MRRAVLQPYAPKKRYIPKKANKEEQLQIRVANYLKKNYPQVNFSSNAAGLYMTIGQAKKWKAMNGERGQPDMTIYYPSRGYYALCLELKRDGVNIYCKIGPRKGQLVANEQIQTEAVVLEELNRLGYLARFVVGYDKACQMIDWYMEKPETVEMF